MGCLVACFDDCPYQDGDFFRYGVGGACPGEFAAAITVAGETCRFAGTQLRAFNGSPGPFASGNYQLYDADNNIVEQGAFTFVESQLADPPAMSSANTCP